MRYTLVLTAAVAITNIYALSFADVSSSSVNILKKARDSIPTIFERKDGGSSGCPAVWTSVVSDLTTLFLDKASGQCNDDARAAIRVSPFLALTFRKC